MMIKESTVKKSGSCNYCSRGNYDTEDVTATYPYDKVIIVSGRAVESVFCPQCLNELIFCVERNIKKGLK